MAVVAAVVTGTGYTPDIGNQITVAFMATGGGQVVPGLVSQQVHQRIHQRGLSAAGGADNSRAFRVNLSAVPPPERPPVVQVQVGQDIGRGRQYLGGKEIGLGLAHTSSPSVSCGADWPASCRK